MHEGEQIVHVGQRFLAVVAEVAEYAGNPVRHLAADQIVFPEVHAGSLQRQVQAFPVRFAIDHDIGRGIPALRRQNRCGAAGWPALHWKSSSLYSSYFTASPHEYRFAHAEACPCLGIVLPSNPFSVNAGNGASGRRSDATVWGAPGGLK
ncbi:hypothetical protein SDC9_184723 [bioreactor metagenome]|uniref:Uncharacterized protein n=1 Tax=bioreactor metagenome TaxID=1076179 RepID=A0A645HDU6_9ZZZZ